MSTFSAHDLLENSHFEQSRRVSGSSQTSSDATEVLPEAHSTPPSPLMYMQNMRETRRLEVRRDLGETHHNPNRAWHRPRSSIDMRALDYLSPYDANLMCAICRCPFVDPVVLYDCDHCFCKDCLRETWSQASPPASSHKGTCPTCRSSTKLVGRTAISKILVNILDDLPVRCPNREDGCMSDMKRGEVSDHVDIYCGHAMVQCPDDDCNQLVRRKDAEACLHHAVTCIDCHQTIDMASLETHWRKACPNRRTTCEMCKSSVFDSTLDYHMKTTCAAVNIPCLGDDYGCPFRSKREEVDVHAKTCVFATLAPFLKAQKTRMDEQEASQRLLSRKVQVLDEGFHALRNLLYPDHGSETAPGMHRSGLAKVSEFMNESSPSAATPPPQDFDPDLAPLSSRLSQQRSSYQQDMVPRQDSSTSDTHHQEPDPFYTDSILPIAAPSSTIPYASPVHHLLSLHESLRDEVSRISTSLQELDSRHSMMILNENLRVKEEMTYVGAQVSGMMRQVGWLTSARLQEQQQRANRLGGDQDEGSSSAHSAQTAVSSAATAIRGAARMMSNGREGLGIGRRTTDEDRVKL